MDYIDFCSWIPSCANVLEELKDKWTHLIPITHDTSQLIYSFFSCVASVMSLHLRSMVLESLADFLEFLKIYKVFPTVIYHLISFCCLFFLFWYFLFFYVFTFILFYLFTLLIVYLITCLLVCLFTGLIFHFFVYMFLYLFVCLSRMDKNFLLKIVPISI